ncbi:hypothetical protein BDQ17DRAFT_1379617 [Cyathus striatus]|nr:hypothetical protein BDQ17DRAFT_1385491 [Cyathus striatus]KAF8981531.1 hypothetical protein BDQ17DRAFT_1379617 [Cyathus striatus]
MHLSRSCLEIYRTLKALGMVWKEKQDLGGLGGVRPTSPSAMFYARSRHCAPGTSTSYVFQLAPTVHFHNHSLGFGYLL